MEVLCLLWQQTSPHENDCTPRPWHHTPKKEGNTRWERTGQASSTSLLGCFLPQDVPRGQSH